MKAFDVVLGILFVVSLYGNYYLYMKLKLAQTAIMALTVPKAAA